MTQQSNQHKPNIIRRAIDRIDAYFERKRFEQLRNEMFLEKWEKSLQSAQAKLEEARERAKSEIAWLQIKQPPSADLAERIRVAMRSSANEVWGFPKEPVYIQNQMSDHMRNEVHIMD